MIGVFIFRQHHSQTVRSLSGQFKAFKAQDIILLTFISKTDNNIQDILSCQFN